MCGRSDCTGGECLNRGTRAATVQVQRAPIEAQEVADNGAARATSPARTMEAVTRSDKLDQILRRRRACSKNS